MSFIIAMEDADNNTEVSSEVEAARIETQVEAAQAETAAAADDIGDDVAQAQQGLNDADELTEIQEQADAAIQRGDGLSEDAAAMATIAVERIHERLYGTRLQRIVPAKETFGHTTSRLASTIAVKESISETLKNFWEAIKAFAIRIWEKIKGLVAKVIGSNKLAGKNIEKMIERVRDLDPTFDRKEKELENESLAKSISVSGKADKATALEVTENAKKLASIASSIQALSDNMVAGITARVANPDVAKVIAEINQFANSSNGVVKKAGVAVAQGLSITTPTKNKASGTATTETNLYGPFPNSVVLCVKKTENKIGAETVETVSFSFVGAKAKSVAKKADALTQGEILEVLKHAQSLNDELVAYGKVSNEYKKITDGVSKLADTIMSSLSKISSGSNDPAAGRVAKEAQRAVQEALSLTNTFSTQGMQIVNSAVHVLTNYASASMANIGPKK